MTLRSHLIQIDVLREVLLYDRNTGQLFWRVRTPSMFEDGKWTANQSCRSWNSRMAGKAAFTAYAHNGYLLGKIFYKQYRAHRVCYAIHYGKWPEEIDHINGVRDDNRIFNLRSVLHCENGRNQKMPITNRSGVMGVCWNKKCQKWMADIKVDGKTLYLGIFDKLEDAGNCRREAQIKYGFHENHGRVL